jgi:NitT/TauT family transport system substrate-binding protein
VDSAILPATAATPLLQSGEAVLLGWADETPYQVAAVFTTPKVIESRRAALERFVKAYARGADAFHATFLTRGADGQPVAGPESERYLAILSRHTGQSVGSVRASIPYIDPKGRLLVGDIHRQVRWYQGQKLVDAAVDPKAVLDLTFVEGHLDIPR